jgi:hypothetical protein
LPDFRHFGFWVKSGRNSEITGLLSQTKASMVAAMGRVKTSRGTENCRKFTILVNSVATMLVISTVLRARYCALNHKCNGLLAFFSRLPLIQ